MNKLTNADLYGRDGSKTLGLNPDAEAAPVGRTRKAKARKAARIALSEERHDTGGSMSAKHYYHFTGEKLRNGDPVPPIGEWIEVAGKITPCVHGLHASEHPFDALSFAPGNLLHLVELGGEIIPHGNPVDKVVAQRRKIIASIDAEKLCRDFARRIALDVLPLWDAAPEVVKRYFKTGDERLRDAVRDAMRAAAWDARDAEAAEAVAYAAEAVAEAAAWGAAWAAARAKKTALYNQWFKEMVDAEFAEVTA